ncbi:MAG: hypothetical protein K0Q55_636, partial [Verrucomicrobia bacterium]|nr:hypothetical protein [Verrucomicrobiota bacterium]
MKRRSYSRTKSPHLRNSNVIIGDNGSGKSSFLRAVALALVGPAEAPALRLDWSSWMRPIDNTGIIFLSIEQDKFYDEWKGKGRQTQNLLTVNLFFVRQENQDVQLATSKQRPANRHVWSGKPGWFSAAYGPYRRFAGGDKDYEKVFYSHPRLARHLSVFGENVALSECLRWLQDLKFKQLEKDPEGRLLNYIFEFINST